MDFYYLVILIVIIQGIVFGSFSAFIAQTKNRSAGGWFVLGFLFSIIAMIALIAVPKLSAKNNKIQLTSLDTPVHRLLRVLMLILFLILAFILIFFLVRSHYLNTSVSTTESSSKRTFCKPIEGFIDIRWGESLQETKKKLQKRNPKASLFQETPYELMYDEGFEMFGSETTLTLEFSSKGFSSGFVFFKYESSYLLNQLKESISAKYGPANEVYNDKFKWNSPLDSTGIWLDTGVLLYYNKRLDELHDKEIQQYESQQKKREADKYKDLF